MFNSKRKDDNVSSRSPFVLDIDQIDQNTETLVKSLIADGFCIITRHNSQIIREYPQKKFQYIEKESKHEGYPINIVSDCTNLENFPITSSEHVNLQEYNHFSTRDTESTDELKQKHAERVVSCSFNECSNLLNEELIPRISMKVTGKYTTIEKFTTTNSYSFVDGLQRNETGVLVDCFSLLSITKFKPGAKLRMITKSNPSSPMIYKNDCPTGFFLLSIGKSFEILTKGLFFNNILKIENADSDEKSCGYFSLSKHLDFDQSFNYYFRKLEDLDNVDIHSELSNRYDALLKKRFWNINRNAMSQIREKPFTMYGYSKTDLEFLKLSEEYSHIDFNLETDLYLVSFDFEDKIGKFVWYNIAFTNNDKSLENENLDIVQHLDRFLEYKISKITKYFERLSKILMSLDNLLFIYFMNHVNFPPINNFLSKLSNILNFDVHVYDILAIKVIYSDSYNLMPNRVKNKSSGNSEKTPEELDFLIGLKDENLNLKTFKEERKLRLTELAKEFKNNFCEKHESSILQNNHKTSQIMKAFHDLDDMIIELNSKMDVLVNGISQQDFPGNKPPAISKNTESLLKSNKKLLINKITEKNKSVNVIDTSSRISKQQPETVNKKMSLIERIKLKQAKNFEQTTLLKDSTDKTNYKELYVVVFTILANLNNRAVFTSVPISSLVDTICRSVFNNHTMAVSGDTVTKVLYHFNDILSDDIFQIVNLSGIASGSVIVKFNFHNKREEVLRCLNK